MAMLLRLQQAPVEPHADSFNCSDAEELEASDDTASALPKPRILVESFELGYEASTRTPSPSWSIRSMFGGRDVAHDDGGFDSFCRRHGTLSFEKLEDGTPCDCFTISGCGSADVASFRQKPDAGQASPRPSASRVGVFESEAHRELLRRKLEACALPARPEASSFDMPRDPDGEEKSPPLGLGAGNWLSDDEQPLCSRAVSSKSINRRRLMEMQKQEVLQAFLASHDFAGVDEPRHGERWVWSSTEVVYPIHLASQLGNYEVVRMLVIAKANPRRKTSKMRSALDFAQEAAHTENKQNVIDLLRGSIEVMSFRDLMACA
mmetsp:Transcript_52061/g.122195  ORF Transcript_52061/g.122195 Transcript_52061/m.122195 type:complete len:320 (-) Transcript_52061:51-1010(-)